MLVTRKMKPKIAVVEIHGVIGGVVKSPEMERLMTRIMDDPGFRAVVLDIDSGGGAAAASDYIYRAARRLAGRKPMVANIRGVGASGAYMIACAAHRIVAAPGSIVGSIGVISARPSLEALLERIGVGVSVNKGGKFKDMGAPWRAATPEEEAKMQELIDDAYDAFVEVVADSREMSAERVREIATGEVYLAPRALEVGLVDELGDLDAALDLAAKAADVPKRRPVYLRPQRGLRARLFGPMVDTLVDAVADNFERRLWRGKYGL